MPKRPHIVIKPEAPPAIKREYNSGGGGGTYPRPSYRAHASGISTNTQQLKAIFASSQDKDTTGNVYYKIKIPEDKKFETTHGQGFEENLFAKIVGSPKQNIAFLSSSKNGFNDLANMVESYKNSPTSVGKSKFAEIEELSQISSDDKISSRILEATDDEESEYLITLYDDIPTVEQTAIIQKIKDFTNASGGKYIDTFEASEGTIVKINSKKDLLKRLADSFISVQSIDINEDVIVESAVEGENLEDDITVLPNTSRAVAGIFDTGVSPNRFLSDSIFDQIFPFTRPPGDAGFEHGTFVASRIIYGDTLKQQIMLKRLEPDVKVLSVCVNKFDVSGNKITTRADILKAIRQTVKQYHQTVRVYNLSLAFLPTQQGVSPWVQDNVVHPVASDLDALAREYDVLFVISAGNFPFHNNYPEKNYPEYFKDDNARILPPSESMLNLCVGSIAKEELEGCMAKKDQASPFTRRGPGYNGYRKPDVVAHGGNYTNTWGVSNFLSATGISPSARLSYGNGTSHAAPLITRIAAKMFEQMPNASATLVKAMIIHSATYNNGLMDFDNIESIIGNGMPQTDKLFNSTKNSQTYLYDGELSFRDTIKIPFYVPTALINRKGKKLNVEITITYSPETRASLSSGYCKSHIRTKIIKLDKQSREKDIAFAQTKEFESERYNTVIKMSKLFSSHTTPGEWVLFLAHESRWVLKSEKIKVAAVITISDPQNDVGIDIFNSIRTEVPNRFLNVIQVPNNIRV